MTPAGAYGWLAPKLLREEREALDIIYAATLVGSAEVFLPAGAPPSMRPVLEKLPQLPQRQDATNTQLRDLRAVAVRLGMYDADDILRGLLERCAG